MNYIDKIKMDDLREEQHKIVDVIGFENLKKLIHEFGGSEIYIPKAETLTKEFRNQQIKQDFKKGKNTDELALKYNLSITTIRRIIRSRD